MTHSPIPGKPRRSSLLENLVVIVSILLAFEPGGLPGLVPDTVILSVLGGPTYEPNTNTLSPDAE